MSRKALVPIQLPADPTQPLEAATKQYVDGKAVTADEVFVGAADPGVGSAYEIWIDTST